MFLAELSNPEVISLEVSEAFMQSKPSNYNMKLPSDFYLGDDDAQFQPVSPERKLLLAVFQQAMLALVSKGGRHREDAIIWFRGTRKGEPISFQYFQSIFKLKASRLKAIGECIGDPYFYATHVKGSMKNRSLHRKH